MENYFKKLTAILMVIVMVFSITGCLSESGGGKAKPPVVVDPTNPINPVDPDNPNIPEDNVDKIIYTPYNPNGNKAPKVTAFSTNDIQEAVVSYGQKVKFEAAGIDPEGSKVTTSYEATGGTFSGNVWTAPNEPGYYQVIAYIIDAEGLKSDPAVITIRVEKPEGEGNIRFSSIPKIIKGSEVKGKRAISIDEGATFNQAYNFILSTRTQDENHTATIEIVFEDPENNHNFAFNAEKGMVNIVSEEPLGNDQYKLTVKYTAPTAATVGDDWNAPVTLTIYNKSNLSDKDVITLPFIANTPPVITDIRFRADSGASSQVIGLNKSGAIEVIAADPNAKQGDTLVYTFNIVSGDGTLNPATTNLGWSDFTAPSTKQKTYISVQVIDSKGGMDQKTFTVFVQDPMEILVRKHQSEPSLAILGNIDDEDDNAKLYKEVNTSETNQYKIGYRGVGTAYARTPISNRASSMGNSSEVASDYTQVGVDRIAQYYYTGAPVERAEHDVVWTVLNDKGEEIRGANNADLGTQDKLTGFDFAPGAGVTGNLRGGTKTLKATVTADMDVRSASDTVRINTYPYIEYVNFATSDGTGIMYNAENGVQTVQLSRGQTILLNVGTHDKDNSDFDPQVSDYPIDKTSGFVINQVGVTSAISGDNKPGLVILADDLDSKINNFNTYNANADTTVFVDPNLAAVARDNYNTRFNDMEFTVPEDAQLDVTTGLGQTYHYMYVHVTDGNVMGVVDGGTELDVYEVPYEIVLKNADTTTRNLKIGTVAGRTSKNGQYMIEMIAQSGSSTPIVKIKDLESGTFVKTITGTDLELVAGDGTLTSADTIEAVNESNNWLAIDINPSEWKAGDKVYFDTFANTVVLRYQIVDGPKVIGVNSMKYATIGDTKGTSVTVLGSVDPSKTARVTITVPDSTHGTIEQGEDIDGDNVLNEVWHFIPPTQMPASKEAKLLINITEVDVENPARTVFEHVIKLNYPPQIVGVSADGAEEGGNNEFWVLKGSKSSIAMSARVSDRDTNDRFKYEWGLQEGNKYGTMYSDGVFDITGLGETSGKYNNGRIDIQVSVRDFDTMGVEKTGYDYRPALIGINEAPRVYNLALADADTLGIDNTNKSAEAKMKNNSDNSADFATVHDFPNAELEFTFNTALGNEVEDSQEDINAGLTYEWYVSADENGETPLLNAGTFYSEPELVDGVMTSRLHWIPSDHVRKSGGTYYVNSIVADKKPGKAQGRTQVTLPVEITADNIAPTPEETHIEVIEIKKTGNGGVYKIGDQIKFRIPLVNGETGDLEKATLDLGEIISGESIVLTNPNRSKHGIDYDYSGDYLEYIYTIPKRTVAADGQNNVDVSGEDIAVTYVDVYGNVDDSGTDLNLAIGFIDNVIYGQYGSTAITTPYSNTNTGLSSVSTILNPGDVITITVTIDTSDYAGAASAKLTGLGFHDLEATTYTADTSFEWELRMPALDGGTYDATTDADEVVLTAVITDNAGNEEIVKITVGEIASDAAYTLIDLSRPKVYEDGAMLFSYRTDENGGSAQLVEANGQVYATLDTPLVLDGVITDDGKDNTAEILVVMFDKDMDTTTLNKDSITVRRKSDGKVLSTGAGANANFEYVATWGDDPATNNRNTLFIALVDENDETISVERGDIIEVLFTAPDDLSVAGNATGVVTDENKIEIDAGSSDFKIGRGALVW